jgi:hypothetical protein
VVDRRIRFIAALVAPLAFAPFMAGCGVSNGRDTQSSVTASDSPPVGDVGTDRADIVPVSAQTATKNPLNSQRAIGYLTQICDLGRRPTGSAGMTAQQRLLEQHFKRLGAEIELQQFQIKHPLYGAAVPVANMIVHWHPQSKQRILLCAHYDTRPFPDRDRNATARRQGTFVGANDGASGTALLMEMAHHMSSINGRYGVDFVLVDAEEFIFEQARKKRYFIGSEYFAAQYAKGSLPYRYAKGAVLDMVGDRDLQIYVDRNSLWWRDTKPVTQEIWGTAKRLGVAEFIDRFHPRMKNPIKDDHLMLRNVGKIPTCEIIDFDYPKFSRLDRDHNLFWHTELDTPDKCSGDSLAKVGWVMLEWIRTAE